MPKRPFYQLHLKGETLMKRQRRINCTLLGTTTGEIFLGSFNSFRAWAITTHLAIR
jgi:hypothetical protein